MEKKKAFFSEKEICLNKLFFSNEQNQLLFICHSQRKQRSRKLLLLCNACIFAAIATVGSIVPISFCFIFFERNFPKATGRILERSFGKLSERKSSYPVQSPKTEILLKNHVKETSERQTYFSQTNPNSLTFPPKI